MVVPTHNGAAVLGTCLRSVVSQDLPDPYEVVVVDDGSTDDTRSVVEQVRAAAARRVAVRYEWQAHLGLNAGRNRGAALARGALVCLVDDDVEAPPTWLPALLEGARRHPDALVLGGPIRLRIEGREPRHCRQDRLPETHLDRGPDLVWDQKLYGANLAFRPSALERAGPFRERMSGHGDEGEWLRRLLSAGGHSLYLPDAWLWHRRTKDELGLLYLMRRSYRHGWSHVPYLASVGMRPTPLGELVTIGRGLGHAACFGCFYGILRACRAAGKLRRIWGAADGDLALPPLSRPSDPAATAMPPAPR
ncbi:MAG: glycosyltransferase family 2 protein [Acidimicrobiales bacterium]